MKTELLSCVTFSVLIASVLCSCGKKDAPPPDVKPQSEPAAAVQGVVPEAREQPAAPAPTKAAEPAAVGTDQSLSGTIGGQHVVMQLSLKGEGTGARTTVTGSYFLEAKGSSDTVTLAGTLQDGSLVLEQSVRGTPNGTFELTNDPANKRVYLGSWKGQGRVLPVKLAVAP